MKEGGERFLNERFPDLQHSDEVEGAVLRQEVRGGEKARNKDLIESLKKEKEQISEGEQKLHNFFN